MDRKAFETKLNVLVGRLLSSELGLKAVSEHISSKKRPDIVIFVNGIKIILEGSYSRHDAEKDVERRLEEGLADLGVALHYKEDYPSSLTDSELENKLRKSNFSVRLVAPKDISGTLISYFEHRKIIPVWITGWIETSITDLASTLNEAIQFILKEEDIEKSIKKIEEKISEFVSRIRSIDAGKRIAKRLYNILYKLYGLSVGNYEEIDELLYAQATLAILLCTTFYQSIRAELGLDDVISFVRQYGGRLGLKKAFEEIYKVDWRPIYTVALEVIDALPDTLNLALRSLTELAMEISSKRTLLRRDFAGKVYHKIVGDWSIRKGFATYFTTVPAAYLLAYLAVFTKTGFFEEFRRTKVGDIACGSGTLLTASYAALRDLYIRTAFEQGNEVRLGDFHRQLLEEDLWGIDALRYAVQIASTNIAFQNPIIQVSKMNMFTIPLGIENGKTTLGSLEFLKGRAFPTVSAYFAEKGIYPFIEGAESATIIGTEEVPSEIPEFDLIIMNPPFTRATGRGGKERGGLFGFIVDDSVRKAVISKYNEFRESVRRELEGIARKYFSRIMLKEIGVERELFNIGQAGEGLLFLYLASKRIKDNGKIAFVLPKSLLTGITWLSARSLLLDKFCLEHVVVSYDAEKGYNFSESTSLSETLIVARKRRENEGVTDEDETTLTILLSKPLTSLEARALAFKILKANSGDYLEVNGSKAYVYKVSRKKLTERLTNWGSLLAFPDPKLTKICDEILSGNLFGVSIPMIRLGEIATLGIDRHQFHDSFKKVEGRPPNSYPTVYGGEEERRSYMSTVPNARILPKTVRGENLFRNFSSNLLIPDRIWVDTAHVVAILCSEPVLSNIFYALRLRSDKDVKSRLKTLCLWFNTTWGILSILANRSETRGRWINLKMTHWRLQPALNVIRLDEDTVGKLAKIFDKYCRRNLRRLPEQFNPNNIDPVRLSIDREFLDSLGIKFDEEGVRELYKLIYENLSRWIEGEES